MSIDNKDPFGRGADLGANYGMEGSSVPGGVDLEQATKAAEDAMLEAMRRSKANRPQNAYAEQTAQAASGSNADESSPELVVNESAELEALKARVKEAEDARLRALAEVDNVRRRMAKEKEDFIKYSASSVLGDILPSIDNLELALEHARGQEACKNFVIGVDMTKKMLLESLKKHGLEPIGAVGDVFDPNLHEAVGMEPDPDVPDGAISKLLGTGYKLHDRLLRPARVIVSKK